MENPPRLGWGRDRRSALRFAEPRGGRCPGEGRAPLSRASIALFGVMERTNELRHRREARRPCKGGRRACSTQALYEGRWKQQLWTERLGKQSAGLAANDTPNTCQRKKERRRGRLMM